MEIPAPVNLAALSGILAKSKQVMAKVETEKPVKQSKGTVMTESYDSGYDSGYDERDEREPIYENYEAPQSGFDPTNVQDYTEEQVMSSNLPPAIKEAMLKNKIPRLSGPPSKVSPEAIAKMTGIQPKPQPQTRQPLVENHNNNGMVTVSKEQLQAMIKEGIDNFFKNDYEKRITEAAIKKTITVLIKEGKLNTKK